MVNALREYADFEQRDRDFYHVFGGAFDQWSNVEAQIGVYFGMISGIEPPLARAVFYSARSFLGRADMLSACIPHAKTPPDGKTFLVRAVNTARGYAKHATAWRTTAT